MPPPPGIEEGLVLKVFAADGTTKVYVNVCGHAAVGLPLTRSMDPIPSPDFMDVHGLDNLIVPISVGDPRYLQKGSEADTTKSLVVDVVVHSEVVRRATNRGHRLHEDIVSKLTALAMEWVTKECGIQLSTRTVKLLAEVTYKDSAEKRQPKGSAAAAAAKAFDSMTPEEQRAAEETIRQRAQKLYEELLHETSRQSSGAAPVPSGGPTATTSATTANTSSGATVQLPEPLLTATKPRSAAAAPRGPLIVELPPKEPLLKKGFLDSAKGSLYGDKGSGEGNLPEGAGDPLGYIPKGLRDKCKIIDTRAPPEAQKPTSSSSAAPQKSRQLPFDFAGTNADEVSGEEFLKQLDVLGSVISGNSGGGAKSVESLAAALQVEMERGGGGTRGEGVGKETGNHSLSATNAAVTSPSPQLPAESAPVTSVGTWEHTITTTHSDDGATCATIRVTPSADVKGIQDIDLVVDSEFIEVNGHRIRPPCLVDTDSVKAKFVKSTRTLVVTLKSPER